MSVNRCIGMFLLVGFSAAFPAVAQEAEEVLNPNDVLARIHFAPSTYELYRPWADKWYEELGKPVAPHRRPKVDGDELVDQRDNLPLDWVSALLSVNAVASNDNEEFVLTVPMPTEVQQPRYKYSRIVEKLFLQVFYDKHGFAEEKYRAKTDEVERIVSEYKRTAKDLEDQRNSHHQRLEADRREMSDETLQTRLAAIEEGPKLELEMNLAEMTARREAILKRLDEAQKRLDIEAALKKSQHEATQDVMRARLELDELRKQLARTQVDGPQSLEAAGARVKELQHKADAIELDARRAASSGEIVEQLKRLLVDAEINAAGLEARRDVLVSQFQELKNKLAKRVELQKSMDELYARIQELDGKIQETRDSLNPDEYRTPRPEIEWVPEPEKAAS